MKCKKELDKESIQPLLSGENDIEKYSSFAYNQRTSPSRPSSSTSFVEKEQQQLQYKDQGNENGSNRVMSEDPSWCRRPMYMNDFSNLFPRNGVIWNPAFCTFFLIFSFAFVPSFSTIALSMGYGK
eukprot:Awhi_evm1s3017